MDNDEDIEKIIKLITTNKLIENKYELKSFLQLIYSISNNHHRSSDFFQKIEKLLLNIITNIKQNFTPKELVKLFYHSKTIILFFIEQKVIFIDDLPQNFDFLIYFYPEIEETLKEEEQKQQYIKYFEDLKIEYEKEAFISKRKIGENDSYICSLIREDSVEDFIAYTNRSNISLSSFVRFSLFETHQYLKENKCSLIEYAAFFGSIQIFNYLKK